MTIYIYVICLYYTHCADTMAAHKDACRLRQLPGTGIVVYDKIDEPKTFALALKLAIDHALKDQCYRDKELKIDRGYIKGLKDKAEYVFLASTKEDPLQCILCDGCGKHQVCPQALPIDDDYKECRYAGCQGGTLMEDCRILCGMCH